MNRPDAATAIRDIVIEQHFDAPPSLVFKNWTDPDLVSRWFAADTFKVTAAILDARPGGAWRVDFRRDSGWTYFEFGTFREIVPPSRLVFTLTQQDGENAGPETLVTVTFAKDGNGTRMIFRQSGFDDAARRDGNAEGWGECIRKLGESLAEHEIRALFADWSAASSRKDIDGSMAPIADNILSYEHNAPLVYRGVGPLREICQAGFDAASDDFTWSIPDLEIRVRGDTAITWGLNRMRSIVDGQPQDIWSRGTRIFERRNGEWKMIHQHVSFPFEPETGKAAFDLKP